MKLPDIFAFPRARVLRVFFGLALLFGASAAHAQPSTPTPATLVLHPDSPSSSLSFSWGASSGGEGRSDFVVQLRELPAAFPVESFAGNSFPPTVSVTSGLSLATISGNRLYLGGNDRWVVFADLKSETTYQARVLGEDQEGDQGSWATSAEVTTTASTSTLSAPGAPQSATATAGDANIRVGWAAPSADGGAPVMSYRLRWKFPVASFAAEDVAVVGASVRAHTITGLRNGEVYDVQVAAGNSEGLGEPAELQATPGGRPNAPAAPTLAAADSAPGTLTVTWSPVSGPVTGYRVRWGKDATSVAWNGSGNGVLAGDESARSYIITGLDGGAAYQVQVAAVNAVGTGAWSPSATATSLGAPGAPAAPTAAVGSAAGSLDITWAAPSSDGGSAVTGYRVRWGQDAASVAWNASGDGVLAGDQNTLSYGITDLKTGTAYQVQVAAVNARGTGAWSPSATATPQAAQDDASITALRVGGADGVTVVTLSPAFSAATTSYAASVATGVTGVIFTADFVGSKLVVAEDTNNAPNSGKASSVVALTVGASRDITLVVTAQDGSTTMTYTVTITRAAGVPEKPAPPTVERATTVSRSINISWTWAGGAANNGSDLTAFHVQWKKTDATNWLPNATGQVISDTSARAYAVTGLDAGARYHARVRAVNGIGNGAWSDNSAANRASGPPAKPISIGLTAIAGGINVNVPQFSEDDGGSPRLGGTQVRWRVSSGPGAWQPDANGRYQTGNNIRGLNCEVQYDVQGAFVNGFAADNVGAWSDIRKATPTCVTLTLNPAAATKVYGASDPALDYQLGGGSFSGGDTKASVFSSAPIERVAGENAGEYDYRLKNPIPWGSNNNPQGKYRVAQTLGGSNKFTITAKEVTYTSTAADKTYDGNTNAPADLGGSFTAGVVTATVNGVAIDDTATGKLSVSGGQFQNKNAGDNKAVTQFALGGDAKDNYTLAAASSVTGDIAKLATTLTLNVNSRVYDATTNTGAVTTVFSPEILSGDTVTVDTSGAAYADADAGTGKTINGVADAQIGGGDKANYEITIVATGEVTKRPLRVAAGGSGNAVPNTAALGDRSLLTIASGVSGEGLVGSDTAATVLSGSIALGTETGSAPRFTSPLTIGSLAASSNYQLIFTAGEFVRSALQTLVVTPAETTRAFGGADPAAFTFTVAPQSGSAFITGDSASTQFFTSGQAVVQRAAGNDAGRYAFSLVDPLPTATGIDAKYLFVIAPGVEYTITPKPLTAAAITLTKEYDGATTIAGAVFGGGVLSGLESSDAATLSLKSGAVGAYDSADVGTGISMTGVDGDDFELTASSGTAANYAIPASLTITGVITAKEVTVAAVTLTKVYDGGTALGASSVKAGSGEVSGEAGSESLALRPTAGDYDAAGVGTRTVSGATFDLVSPDSSAKPGNYTLPASITVAGEITAKEVAVADVTVTKTFDDTDSMAGVVLTGGAVTGTVGSQAFTLQLTAANDGTYDSVNAGTGVGVTGADFELAAPQGDTASDPANYSLPSLTVIGVIEPKGVTISGAATLRKSYDGGDTAEATGANAVVVVGAEVQGAVGANTFRLALASGHDITYPQSDAGGPLTFTNADAADFALQSAGDGDPANYQLPGEIAALGEIAPREVTVAAATLTKPYDGTAVVGASVAVGGGALGNLVAGEALELEIIPGLGGYPQNGVGENLQMSGVQFRLADGAGGRAANYQLPSGGVDATGVIAAKEVSVSAPQLVKEFDNTPQLGNSKLAAGGGGVTGAVGDDALILAPTAGLYASSSVGTGIRVSNITWELQTAPGASGDPNNYALPASLPAELETGGEITPKTLTLTLGDTVPTKVYNGDTTPPALTAVITAVGVVTGADNVSFARSNYNSKDVLTARFLEVVLSGADAGNYQLDASVSGIPARITPKTIGVTGTLAATGGTTKVYDGTTAAPSGFSQSGLALNTVDVIEADRGKVSLGTGGVYNSKNVADANAIAPQLTGEEAGNYQIAETVAGTITARPLRVSADDVAALAQPDAADLRYTLASGAAGEGLVAGETAEEVLSGELAYGAANPSGTVPILRGTLAVVGGNYTMVFTSGLYRPSGRLDLNVDGNATFEEGAVIMRYLFGLRGDALTANLSTLSGSTAAGLEQKMAALVSDGVLDVDGNAGTTARDGVIIARYLLGVTEAASLIEKFGAAANADSALAAVRALLPTP